MPWLDLLCNTVPAAIFIICIPGCRPAQTCSTHSGIMTQPPLSSFHPRAAHACVVSVPHHQHLLQTVWSEVLRCVSRRELLQQMSSGGPSDALLFSQQPQESPVHSAMSKFRDRLLMRGPSTPRAASQQLNKAGE